MIKNLKDGMMMYTLWVCPKCGEREGFKFVCECLEEEE